MITNKTVHGAFLAAGVAMAMVTGACAGEKAKTDDMSASKVQCKESNSCKGQGSCGGVAVGEKHGCKGQNGCAGNLREVTKDECAAIKGAVVASK
jgi:hypothetical protein